MAIVPSAQFPGQIITGDPGYPLGKPRNVTVTGDGTGTPLRAQWVADLFGWQQALLDRASITPSGNPDEVGASDYMDSLDALYPAIGRMDTAESDIAALEGRSDTLETDVAALEASRITGPASSVLNKFPRFADASGKLAKDGPIGSDDAGNVSGVADLVLSGEVIYTAAKTRTIVLPARLFVPVAGTAWTWSDTSHRWQIPADDNAGDYMWLDFSLPVGVQITKFEILVESTEGNLRGMGCRLFEKAYAASFGDGTDIGGGAASTSVNANVVGIAQNSMSPRTTVSATYRIRGQKGSPSGAGATFDRLGDVRITILDPGPKTA